jgi:hypothetical protein
MCRPEAPFGKRSLRMAKYHIYNYTNYTTTIVNILLIFSKNKKTSEIDLIWMARIA